MRNLSRRALLTIAMAAGAGRAFPPWVPAHAESPSRTPLWGYDPVSYFTAGHPEQGSAEFSFHFDDTTYWFASKEHRKMFAADPERYARQFKGYCAASVARGRSRRSQPALGAGAKGRQRET
jgi:YHS domain-containing protein